MVSNEHELVREPQWTKTCRQSYLRRLVYDTIIERPPGKQRTVASSVSTPDLLIVSNSLIDRQTRGSHDRRRHELTLELFDRFGGSFSRSCKLAHVWVNLCGLSIIHNDAGIN